MPSANGYGAHVGGRVPALASIEAVTLLTRLDLRGVPGDLGPRLPAPKAGGEGPVEAVREILAAVAKNGDSALEELTSRFDGVAPVSLRVPPTEVRAALDGIDSGLRRALEAAAGAIRSFHEAERDAHRGFEHTSEHGVITRERLVPVGRAGCYVTGRPGAPLASTVLMTAVPARVAGRGRGGGVLASGPGRPGARPPSWPPRR